MTSSTILPIIMLALTLVGGGIMLLVINQQKKAKTKPKNDTSRATAQDFVNVKDIRGNCLITGDGLALCFVRISPISIDLYSNTEKSLLIKQLTSELSEINYPFKYLALSRPVDISPLINNMQELLLNADDVKQKLLLRQEILEMSSIALSGEIVERQFFISIWDKESEAPQLIKKAATLTEKFTINGIGSELLFDKELIQLLNLVNNPSTVYLENTDYNANIPILSKEQN